MLGRTRQVRNVRDLFYPSCFFDSSARSMLELCDLTPELWSCLPDHPTRHLQNAVLIESHSNEIFQSILQTLGGEWLSSRGRRHSPPHRTGLPAGRERQYLNSGMQETA